MLPKLILIGAMKSGTTSLFEYLKTHPEFVPPSRRKEPNFFSINSIYNMGPEWYEDLFSREENGGSVAFEASGTYTKRHLFPFAAERIYNLLPEAQLVYLVRDPLERIVSHYRHQMGSRGRWENRPFSLAIRESRDYIDTSRYAWQLDPYLERFSRDQICVVTTERLKTEPSSVLAEIASFAGVDDAFDRNALDAQHHKTDNRGRVTRAEKWLFEHVPTYYGKAAVAKVMEPLRPLVPYPEVSESDRAFLADRLRVDIERFRKLTGLPLDEWSV